MKLYMLTVKTKKKAEAGKGLWPLWRHHKDYNSHDASVPLGRRPVHDDVDPQDLHGVERVGEVHQRGQGDERQGRDAPAGQQRAGLEHVAGCASA